MHKITFYPVGNGDTCQIILNNDQRFLFDYRHLKQAESDESPHIGLEKQLRDELQAANRDYFDVVAFTHGDKDHIENSTEFFELEHAAKYQGNGRIKIKELWVPAAMILESSSNDDSERPEFTILRQEARHRLIEGKGIRVFSQPKKLKGWLESKGLTLESRSHLITNAGETVPGYALNDQEVEFFCHSPFIKHVDENDIQRNEASLIFQIRLNTYGTRHFNYFAVGDSTWDVLEDIVEISNYHNNENRLDWDLFNIPHHCSYLALSDEKGERETIPAEKVKELLNHAQLGAYMVSSSAPIGCDDDAYEQIQPPHVQAKKCYENHLKSCGGRKIMVTMEEPNTTTPKPLAFIINKFGCQLEKKTVTGAILGTTVVPPRAG